MKKAFLLVSINARAMTPEYIGHIIQCAARRNHQLTIIMLDQLEFENQLILNAEAIQQSENIRTLLDQAVWARCVEIQSGLKRQQQTGYELMHWSEIAGNEDFRRNYAELKNLFDQNPSFRNYCLNQTYQNLQPILNAKGIYNKQHPSVHGLSDYLLKEIALKLILNDPELYVAEFAPRAEMKFFLDIMGGKYPQLNSLVKERIEYIIEDVPQTKNSLTTSGISFAHQEGEHSFHLENIDLTISSDNITGILGENGSGKTTLLKLIGGHLSPNKGSIKLNDTDLTKLDARKRETATVFQDMALFPHLSVVKNVMWGISNKYKYPKKVSHAIAMGALFDFGLIEYAEKLPEKLSLGLQQRVAILRSIVMKPKILLMDEPTASLDFIQKERLVNTIRDFRRKNPEVIIIIVSHDKDFIYSICDRMVLLKSGKIIADDNIDNIRRSPRSLEEIKYLDLGNLIRGQLTMDYWFSSEKNEISIELPPSLVGDHPEGEYFLYISKADIVVCSADNIEGTIVVKIIEVNNKLNDIFSLMLLTQEGLMLTSDTRKPAGVELAHGSDIRIKILTDNLKLLSHN